MRKICGRRRKDRNAPSYAFRRFHGSGNAGMMTYLCRIKTMRIPTLRLGLLLGLAQIYSEQS